MLTVEKIGGTSMSRFGEVLENVIKGNRSGAELFNRIFVVSAYSNVTNWLLEHKKSGTPGIYKLVADKQDYSKALDELTGKLKDINKGFESVGLDLKDADEFIEKRIAHTKGYLDSMAHVISSGYVEKGDILLAAREMLASIGEAHSAYNSTQILNKNGVNAVFVDLSGFYDDDVLTIDERIAKSFEGIDFKTCVVIATGYTRGSEGIMREFDRGYSEVTFSKIAVQVKADEAIIHKEFHLSSADPKVVGEDNAVIVGYTNFDVADQLADVGMEAVHPKASKPLENNGISLRVKNAFDPENPGTVITKDYVGQESKVEIITGTDKVTLVEIHDPSMVGTAGFDLNIMKYFYEYNISYILKTTNANSISNLIWEKDKATGIIEKLSKNYELVSTLDVAVVCAIGSNIAKPGVLEHATKALAANGINIICISQSMRQVNMQFVIDRKDYVNAVKVLHTALCE